MTRGVGVLTVAAAAFALASQAAPAYAQVKGAVAPPANITIIREVTTIDRFDFVDGQNVRTHLGAAVDFRVVGNTGPNGNRVSATAEMRALDHVDGSPTFDHVIVGLSVVLGANRAFDFQPESFPTKELTRTVAAAKAPTDHLPDVVNDALDLRNPKGHVKESVSEFRRELSGPELGCQTNLLAQVLGPAQPPQDNRRSLVKHRRAGIPFGYPPFTAPVFNLALTPAASGANVTVRAEADPPDGVADPVSWDLQATLAKGVGVGDVDVTLIGKVSYYEAASLTESVRIEIEAYFRDSHPQPFAVDVDHWIIDLTRGGGVLTADVLWALEASGTLTVGAVATPVFARDVIATSGLTVPPGE